MRTIPAKQYSTFFQLVICADAAQVRMWFTGSVERHQRTERVLRRLVERGKLKETKLGVMKIYYAPKYDHVGNIEHGLGVTEGLVRFWRSDMTSEIILSKHFRGMGSIPEWGMKFGDTHLLYEFCTRSNYYGRLRKKIGAYEDNILKIAGVFGESFVLFVCDVDRKYLRNFQPKPDWAFFTDYETFRSVPIGSQLTAPIYFWCDGKEYPLRGPEPT